MTLPGGSFEVADVCSGFRYLNAGLALGVLVAQEMFISWRRRAAFVALVLSQVTGYLPFLLILALMAFMMVPVPSLWDSYAVSAADRGGASFSTLRIFGSLGFMGMVLATGALMSTKSAASGPVAIFSM